MQQAKVELAPLFVPDSAYQKVRPHLLFNCLSLNVTQFTPKSHKPCEMCTMVHIVLQDFKSWASQMRS